MSLHEDLLPMEVGLRLFQTVSFGFPPSDKNPHFPEETIQALRVFSSVSFRSLHCGLNIAGVRCRLLGGGHAGRRERGRGHERTAAWDTVSRTPRGRPKGAGSGAGRRNMNSVHKEVRI